MTNTQTQEQAQQLIRTLQSQVHQLFNTIQENRYCLSTLQTFLGASGNVSQTNVGSVRQLIAQQLSSINTLLQQSYDNSSVIIGGTTQTSGSSQTGTRGRRSMSAAARRKLSIAAKQRYAQQHGQQGKAQANRQRGRAQGQRRGRQRQTEQPMANAAGGVA